MKYVASTVAISAFVTSLLLGGAGIAVAGDMKMHGDKDHFTRLDTNMDGKISQEEANADSTVSGQFSTLDQNQDSQVDQAEFARFEITEGEPAE